MTDADRQILAYSGVLDAAPAAELTVLRLFPQPSVPDDFTGQPRRAVYRRMVGRGLLPAGYASEDGVGLHYTGTRLHEAVSILPGKRAWHVQPGGTGGYRAAHPSPPAGTSELAPR